MIGRSPVLRERTITRWQELESEAGELEEGSQDTKSIERTSVAVPKTAISHTGTKQLPSKATPQRANRMGQKLRLTLILPIGRSSAAHCRFPLSRDLSLACCALTCSCQSAAEPRNPGAQEPNSKTFCLSTSPKIASLRSLRPALVLTAPSSRRWRANAKARAPGVPGVPGRPGGPGRPGPASAFPAPLKFAFASGQRAFSIPLRKLAASELFAEFRTAKSDSETSLSASAVAAARGCCRVAYVASRAC